MSEIDAGTAKGAGRRAEVFLSPWGAWCFSDWGSFSSLESIG